MRILRRNRISKIAVVALASTFAVATSECLQGQGFVNASLPSYYAGQTAAVQIAEPTRVQAVAVVQVKPIQATTIIAASPKSTVQSLASGAAVQFAQNDNAWSPRRANGVVASPQHENTQKADGRLPANRGVGPIAPEEVQASAGRDAEGTEVAKVEVEKVEAEGAEVEGKDVERKDVEKTDAERRATLRGEVYDGLPIEGRFERRTAPRAHLAPQAERNADVQADEGGKHKEGDEAEGTSQGEDGNGEDCEDEDCEDEDCEDEDCEDEDGEDEDELAEHFEAVERVLDCDLVRNMLGLIKENIELKAQLKIQQIEFAARQQAQAAEHQQREAQRRLQEMERGNEELRRENHAVEQRGKAQNSEAIQHCEVLERELTKSTRELNELRMVNQQLQLQAEKLHVTHQQTLQEAVTKLDDARRSKTELEHRARALETRLEELKGKLEGPHKAEKKKKS